MTARPFHTVPHLATGTTRAEVTAAETATWAALSAHARSAAAAVLRLPASHPDVEDRAQDALVAFLASGLPRFDRALGTHEALVRAIARNCALSHLRSRRARARLAERLEAPAPPVRDGGHRRVEAARDLVRVLSRLRVDHVEALVGIDLEGERIGERAAREGRTYEAVNAQVGHARAAARGVARELLAA